MRLICPNCGAQYEVSDDIVPENGRDVQCSNCGHTWFEHQGVLDEETEIREAFVPDPEPEIVRAPEPEPTPEPTPEPEPEPTPAPPEPEPTPEPGPELRVPTRQEIAPGVASILNEERQREEAARAAEISIEGSEGSFDIGAQRAEESRRRMARMRGEPEALPLAEGAPRSDLLPDIEEINSSLDPDTEHYGDTAPVDAPTVKARRRSGFRLGFGLILICAALAVMLYLFAPKIITAMPSTEVPLTSYVETINNGRLWLDIQLQGLLEKME